MNALSSMAASLLIGLVLGVFIVIFGDGMQVFNSISHFGLILGTVAFTIISIDAMKTEKLDFLKLALLGSGSIILALGISTQNEASEFGMFFVNAAPWVVIVFLVIISLFVALERFGVMSDNKIN